MSELCCERCGSAEIGHFLGPGPHGRRYWQNRCAACGKCSEYVPTRDEIAAQCRAIRTVQDLKPLDDEQEKAWRRLNNTDDAVDDLDDGEWFVDRAA